MCWRVSLRKLPERALIFLISPINATSHNLNLRRSTDMLLSRSGPLSFRPKLIPHMTHIFGTAAGHKHQRGWLRLRVLDLCSILALSQLVSSPLLVTPCLVFLLFELLNIVIFFCRSSFSLNKSSKRRVVQYCQIESIGKWVITIRSIQSICQMENSYIRLEKSSFPLDCCISLARLKKISP